MGGRIPQLVERLAELYREAGSIDDARKAHPGVSDSDLYFGLILRPLSEEFPALTMSETLIAIDERLRLDRAALQAETRRRKPAKPRRRPHST